MNTIPSKVFLSTIIWTSGCLQCWRAHYRNCPYYCLQWSCESYVFTGICLSTGGVCLSACWDTHPLRVDTPPEQTPPEQTQPLEQNPQSRHTPWSRHTPRADPRSRHPLRADICLSTGDVCLSAWWDIRPPEQTHPLEQTPPGADTPLVQTPWSRHSLRADTPWEQTSQGRHTLGPDTPLGADTPGVDIPSRSRHPLWSRHLPEQTHPLEQTPQEQTPPESSSELAALFILHIHSMWETIWRLV